MDNIGTNTGGISANNAALATNTANIANNIVNIANLNTDADTNRANIANNDLDITSITEIVGTNTAAISTNTDNIGINTGAISTNTDNIGTLKDLLENENLKTKVMENTEKMKIIWENIKCPLEKSGYFEVLGKCYFTDTIKRNFDDSQAHCKEIFPLGGRLFEPRNLTTNKKVRENRLEDFSLYSHAFIGITDRISQGSYRYESDNGQLTVSQWNGVEPNNDNEHCVTICSSSGDWCDDPCSSPFLHICERTYNLL